MRDTKTFEEIASDDRFEYIYLTHTRHKLYSTVSFLHHKYAPLPSRGRELYTLVYK